MRTRRSSPRLVRSSRQVVGLVLPEPLESRMFLSASALDTSFNGTGLAALPMGHSLFHATTVLPDGRVLAVGNTEGSSSSEYDFLVARFKSDGKPDPTFGGGTGRVLTGFPNKSYDRAWDVLQLADGKFVVLGVRINDDGLEMARYNANGSLDTSFGTGGLFHSAALLTPTKAALLSDGKILVVGSRQGTTSGQSPLAVARFNANGTVDTTFGGGTGWRSITLPGGMSNATDVAVGPGGSLYVAGNYYYTAGSPSAQADIFVAKLRSSGSLDTSFAGGKGWARVNVKNSDLASSIALLRDGKLLVGGTCDYFAVNNVPQSDMVLLRYTAGGWLDKSFGGKGTGYARINFGTHSGGMMAALSVRPDGKVLAVGSVRGSLALARVRADGTLDTSFSGDGKQTYSQMYYGTAVADAPGGKVVVTGAVLREGSIGAGVVRFGSDFAATASISGSFYNDLNGNGVRNTGEPALSAWRAYVDSNNDGVFTPGEPIAASNSSGYYKISGLVPGTYRIREVRLNGWNRTQPAGVYPLGYYDVTLSVGQAATAKNFGNKKAV